MSKTLEPKSHKTPSPNGPELDRRTFLRYVGAGSAAIFTAPSLLQLGCAKDPCGRGAWTAADGTPDWHAPRYPVPLPSDPPSAGGAAQRLAEYEVIDDLVLPEGFRYDVIASWGDTFGPAGEPGRQIRFGYNNDYTGLLPIDGTDDEYWLFVNHEYVSGRTWLAAYEEVFGEPPPELRHQPDPDQPWVYPRGVLTLDGYRLELGDRIVVSHQPSWLEVPEETRTKIRDLAGRILSQVGVSVLRVRRDETGGFHVVEDAPDHRRIHAWGRQNVDVEPSFSGPATYLFDRGPRGTMTNCSGGTTPWGTFLTCEENFYNEVSEDITPAGRPIEGETRNWGVRADRVNGLYVFDHPVPSNIYGNGHVLEDPLDGREYGWVSEVEPTTGALVKHTALGRFRHENVALRCEEGKHLAAYMGDDRRGGHVWKFVSEGVVEDPTSPETGKLLERGTLYAARFDEDFTGEWIPIEPDTPLRRPEPEHCPSGHVQVPSRFVGGLVAVGDTDRDYPSLEVDDWVGIIERYTEKPFDQCTLGDLVRPEEGATPEEIAERQRGILLMDAFGMANACGGTPTARPEDLEVHPIDATVYIAFTDATFSSTGSPDMRIFPDSTLDNSRQYGAIYRLIEGGEESADSDPAAKTFTWGKFVASGEVAEQGGGFACADNMAFDHGCNLWMMTDISTSVLNFPTSRRLNDGSYPGGRTFAGVFGNNALFMIPTEGPNAGVPQLFALAPMDAELCGPSFTDDDETLILSVQHPGENDGVRTSEDPSEVDTYVIHDRDDQPFDQKRTVPKGSNWPSGELDRPPRPSVVALRRAQNSKA